MTGPGSKELFFLSLNLQFILGPRPQQRSPRSEEPTGPRARAPSRGAPEVRSPRAPEPLPPAEEPPR